MAKQSLAAKTGALTTELKLPAIFSAPMEKIESKFQSPYICFAHPKRSDEWAKITSKTGRAPEEHDMFLIESNNVTPLPVAKLGWMCHKQYWCETNAVGEVIRVSFAEYPDFKEHIEAVVLVYFDDRITPANVCFRTTKCGAAKSLSDALLDAATVAWGEKSPAHRDSMVCSQPFFRFYGDVKLGPTRVSKSGKGAGNAYKPLVCDVKPTTTVEWQLQKAFCEDPATQDLLSSAANRFESRVKEMQSKPQVA